MSIKCPACTKDKKCLMHYDYDTSEYITLPPDARTKRLLALEKENQLLLKALWHCGTAEGLTAEVGIRTVVPDYLADKIDFKRLESVYCDIKKKSKLKCEICGGEICADKMGVTEWYAGSNLRIIGVDLTFRIDKEWVICGKCGDKIHERLQLGEDRNG